MKVSFQLTLDGLLRALRNELHAAHDRLETDFRAERPTAMNARDLRIRRREGEDERSR